MTDAAVREEVLYAHECKVLSCALANPEAAFEMVERLTAEDFYDSRTRQIAEAIHQIVLSGGLITSSSVARKLKAKKDLACLEDDVVAIKAELSEFDEFVGHVLEESKARRLDSVCLNTRAQIGSATADTLVDGLMQDLIKISLGERDQSFTPMAQLFDETLDEIKARSDGYVGMSTSLKTLDNLIGGFQPKKLYVIAGRPGQGKSAFAMQAASHLAFHHDVPTAFFSIEMPERELMRRVMANIAGVEYWRIEKKYWSNEHLERIQAARDRLVKMPLFINDSGGISISQMIAKIKGLKIKFGNLGPIFIDYLQLMKIPIPRGSNRDIAIGDATRAFKVLSKDLNVPVVLLSQIRRAVEDRDDKRPTLADLRESGNIEQDADVVVFAYRDHYYTEDPLTEKDCELIVAKNRAGRVGTANVHVDLDYQKFSDIEGAI